METKQITNADRIRAMTDEELAAKVSRKILCGLCPCGTNCDWFEPDEVCRHRLLAWLRSPVESEGEK